MYFFRKLPFLIVLTLALSACSGPDLAQTPAPEELYRLARVELKEENFTDSREYLAQLREEYPFSPHAVEAELLEADIYFVEENFELAIEGYAGFQSLHPFHEKVAYSVYRKGLSYVALTDTIDRDQSAPRNAAETFTQLIEGFPGNVYVARAKEQLAKCRDLMAQHELYVAKFYERTERPDAALLRLRSLIKEYPDSSVNEEALTMALRLESRPKTEKSETRYPGEVTRPFDYEP